MEKAQFLQILSKYIDGRATEEEQAFLFAYYDLFVADADVMNLISADDQQQLKLMMKANIDGEIDRKAIRRPTIGVNAPKYKLRTRQVWLVSAAAVAVMTLGVWLYYSSKYQDSSIKTGRIQYATDIAPGKNTATLTLASGEVINLSDQKTGVVIGNEKISYSSLREGTTRQSHDEIASIPRNDGKVHNLAVSTPRGGQYQVVLPDGTKVWLNADSKISFPSQFSGRERKVLLEGEAYFAVVHNVKQPFRVESRGQVVEDIGTEFNISAYPDESSVKTTLVEGSASVSSLLSSSSLRSRTEAKQPVLNSVQYGNLPGRGPSTTQSLILKPNQQATLKNGNLQVREIDPATAIAWKNSKFMFEEETIQEIMKKIERWYDVEAVYEGTPPEDRFGGSVSRFDKISKVLQTLERTGRVHFKIEGRKVFVSK